MADTNRTKPVVFQADANGNSIVGVDTPAIRVRTTNEGLQWNKTVSPSTEIQPNRNVSDMVDIGAQGSGTLAFELHAPRANSDVSLFLQSLMGSSWAAKSATSKPLGSSSANITLGYTASSGTLTIADGGKGFLSAGAIVNISGAANRAFNGPWVCTASGSSGDAYVRPTGYAARIPLAQDIAASNIGSGAVIEAGGMALSSANMTVSITPSGSGTVDIAFMVNGTATPIASMAVGGFFALRGMQNAGNNGFYRVVTVNPNSHYTCDVFPANTVAESGTSTGTIYFSYQMQNGTDERYVNIDVTNYSDNNSTFTKHYQALRVGQTQFSFETTGITSGTHTFMGKNMTSDTNDAVSNDIVLTDRGMSSRANVVMINAGSVSLSGMAAAKTLSLTVNNNLRAQPGLGSYGLVGIGTGQFTVTGSMSAYFQSPALYQAFLNTQSIPLHWGIGIDGSYLFFSLPKCRITSATESAKGINQDLTTDINFQAVEADTGGYTMELSYFPYVGS
jgi:hypothetical protein